MSERDFSGRLAAPFTTRFFLELSNRASTASCSIRFSFLMMMSGALRASSLFRRLLRLMTRRYEVVEVRGGETAAVKLDHGPQLGRDDGNDLQDHPLGLVRGGAELLDELDALQEALVRLGALVDHLAAQLFGQRVDVHPFQQRADGLGAHARGEGHAVALARLEELLLGEDLHALQLGVARVDHDVLLIEENGAQRGDLQVEEQPDARGHRAVIPYVGDGGGQLDPLL